MVHIAPVDLQISQLQSWTYQGELTLESGRLIKGYATPSGKVTFQAYGVVSPSDGSFSIVAPLTSFTISNATVQTYYTVPTGLSAIVKNITVINDSESDIATVNLFIE